MVLRLLAGKHSPAPPIDPVPYPSPKDYYFNFSWHCKNDQPYVSFPQNTALLGGKYELACIHWTVGINMFFLGNVYWGISLQAHSVCSALELFSFHSTTQKDEKSKLGEIKWRPHKSWCFLDHTDSPWTGHVCTPSVSSEVLSFLSLPSHLWDSMTLAIAVCQKQLITVGWFQWLEQSVGHIPKTFPET